jgi:hypothetical protein
MLPEPPDTAPPGMIPEPPSQTPMPGSIPTPGSLPPPPPGEYQPGAKPRRGTGRRVISIFIAIVVVVAGGAIFRAVREATASPKDKAACNATVTMIENSGQTINEALQAWSAADDEKIRAEITNIQAAIAARDPQKLADSVNRVIARCNRFSSDFRSRFSTYCKTHEGACKQNFGF